MTFKDYFLVWDGYGLEKPGTGIHRYAQNMARSLIDLGIFPTVLWDCLPGKPLDHRIDYQVVSSWIPSKTIRRLKVAWPAIAASHLNKCVPPGKKKAIFHGLSNFNVPLSRKFCKRFRTVLTVHDLIPFIERKSVSSSYYFQLRHLMPKVLRSVDHIVCVSEWTRSVVNTYFSGFDKKITVIPNGFPSHGFHGHTEKLERPDSNRVRLLYISRFEKYKKIDFLLKILQKSPEKVSLDLVTDNKGRAFLSRVYMNLIKKGTLRIWSGLTDEALRELYCLADVYVHTSLYEGFGLPVAEAMSFGLPVVFQSGSAVDEVVGPNGGFPMHGLNNSPEDWLDRILEAHHISKTDDFQSRIKQICESKGDWSQSARTLITIYDSLGS